MSDRDRGLALLAEADDRQRRLARAVCLAIFVEPGLLRHARRALVPDADFGTERDLWFGPLVLTRNATGIRLEPDALAVLRSQIADGTVPPLFAARARRLVQEAHRAYPPTLRLEEDILWEATRDDIDAPYRIESRLREAVKTMVTTAPPRAREVARWAAQAWGRLPAMAKETEAARQLAVGSSLRIGTVVGPAVPGAGDLPGGLSWLSPASLETVAVGIQVHTDGVRFVAPEGDAQVIRPPRTSPPVVELAWQRTSEAESRVVAALVGTEASLPPGWFDLTLRTLDGRRYEMRAGAGSGGSAVRRRRLIVSHAAADERWAEWVAWQLEDGGYQVLVQVGRSASKRAAADGIVVLLSRAYAESGLPEFPGRRLVTVRIQDVPSTTRGDLGADLFGLSAVEARRVLLGAVARTMPSGAGLPAKRPSASTEPRFPGTPPAVWNMPARDPGFIGRSGLLQQLRDSLRSQTLTAVTALDGMGGIGKTALAVEYAYRFADDYDLVWWIQAENANVIGAQLADLATTAGWASADIDLTATVEIVRERLQRTSRWLLIFDNAENPSAVREWLPKGPGHILITSRNSRWSGFARPMDITTFPRAESIALIQHRLPSMDDVHAGRLAEALGDLPLALAQAIAVLAETALPVDTYLAMLERNAAELSGQALPSRYPAPLAAALGISLQRLSEHDPAAAQLLEVCASFAPEPVPIDLFPPAAPDLLEPLATVASSDAALYQSVASIRQLGLARIDADGLQLHRLVSALLRDRLSFRVRTAVRRQAEAVLVAAEPPDSVDPAHWPRWAQLLPHLLTMDPATSENGRLRAMACEGVWYLLNRGDVRTARQLAEAYYQSWSRLFGPDTHDAIAAEVILSRADAEAGRYAEARERGADALARRRRLLGDDHPDTLNTANNLAVSLTELGRDQEARLLYEDTLMRQRRALGDDHPNTLVSASNLAITLRELGEHQRALQLDEDTLDRQRRLLGDDHPDTLRSVSNLADDLASLGDHEQALRLRQDTLDRRRRVLGDDHPDTLRAMADLAGEFDQLGRPEEARTLFEEAVARSRRVLGEDHPATRAAVRGLSELHG